MRPPSTAPALAPAPTGPSARFAECGSNRSPISSQKPDTSVAPNTATCRYTATAAAGAETIDSSHSRTSRTALAARAAGTTRAGDHRVMARDDAATATSERTAAAAIANGRRATSWWERNSASRVARAATCWPTSAAAASTAGASFGDGSTGGESMAGTILPAVPSGISWWFRFDPYSSGGATLDPEENRAFLQERIAFFARLGPVIVLATYLALILAHRLDADREGTVWLGVPGLLHVATAAVLAAVWLACRSGPLSSGTLHALDMLGSLAVSTTASLALAFPEATPDHKFLLLLGVSNALIARAAAIPSPPQWTFSVSAAAVLPCVVLTYVFHALRGDPAAARGDGNRRAVGRGGGEHRDPGLQGHLRPAPQGAGGAAARPVHPRGEDRGRRDGRRLPRAARHAPPADRGQAAPAGQGRRAQP